MMRTNELSDSKGKGIFQILAEEEILTALSDSWIELAGMAWYGYKAHGRGAIIVEVENIEGDNFELSYSFMHWPSPDHTKPDHVIEYDPERQVVFMLELGNEVYRSYILSGLPIPHEAAKHSADPHRHTGIQKHSCEGN